MKHPVNSRRRRNLKRWQSLSCEELRRLSDRAVAIRDHRLVEVVERELEWRRDRVLDSLGLRWEGHQ